MSDDKVALTTLERIKTFLNITNENSDSILNQLLQSVSEEVQNHCNRKFLKATHTEYFDGDKAERLFVSNFPIISITSIHDDIERVFGADTLVDTDSYVADSENGIIQFDYPIGLGTGQKNVQVIYEGGYETIPMDLQDAVVKKVSAAFLFSRSQINTQEGMEIQNTRIEKMIEEADKTIERYRRFPSGR